MPFVKGQSGNPGGRTKDKPYRDALRWELEAAGDDFRALRAIARAQIEKAMAGDMRAIEHISDKLDGKIPQPVGGSDGLPPIQIERIERVIVDPKQPEHRDPENIPAAAETSEV